MQLFKYCKSEHNVTKGCQTLRLGTLEFYLTLEFFHPSADPTEGKRRMIGSAGTYSVNDLSALTGGRIVNRNGGNYSIIAGNVNLNFDEVNCYIFSCSLNPKKNFFNYDSCYLLEDAESVAMSIQNMLNEQIVPDNLEN